MKALVVKTKSQVAKNHYGLTLNMSKEDYEAFGRKADELNATRSELIRTLCRAVINGDISIIADTGKSKA